MVIDFRDARGRLQRVTRETDLRELTSVKALYVTTKALLASDGSAAGCSEADGDDGDALDDNVSLASSDAASSVLVDLSLAGCCGVQSTCGGLVIQSDPRAFAEAERARSKGKRRSQPEALGCQYGYKPP